MFLGPVKADLNANATVTVRFVPDPDTEDPVPMRVHCEFWTVPALPGVTGARYERPSSITRCNAFVEL
jgi:hypothetical protein